MYVARYFVITLRIIYSTFIETTFFKQDFLNWATSGANVSHNLILKPLHSGIINITSAVVTYQPKEEAEQQVCPHRRTGFRK